MGSMSGDRVTPRDSTSPLNVMLVEAGKDGPRTSVWEPKDGQSGWTDDKSTKERRDTLRWGLKLSLDQESTRDDGPHSHSTNGLQSIQSANGAPGRKAIGKEVNYRFVQFSNTSLYVSVSSHTSHTFTHLAYLILFVDSLGIIISISCSHVIF